MSGLEIRVVADLSAEDRARLACLSRELERTHFAQVAIAARLERMERTQRVQTDLLRRVLRVLEGPPATDGRGVPGSFLVTVYPPEPE